MIIRAHEITLDRLMSSLSVSRSAVLQRLRLAHHMRCLCPSLSRKSGRMRHRPAQATLHVASVARGLLLALATE